MKKINGFTEVSLNIVFWRLWKQSFRLHISKRNKNSHYISVLPDLFPQLANLIFLEGVGTEDWLEISLLATSLKFLSYQLSNMELFKTFRNICS